MRVFFILFTAAATASAYLQPRDAAIETCNFLRSVTNAEVSVRSVLKGQQQSTSVKEECEARLADVFQACKNTLFHMATHFLNTM
jgi:hypothetical protein